MIEYVRNIFISFRPPPKSKMRNKKLNYLDLEKFTENLNTEHQVSGRVY